VRPAAGVIHIVRRNHSVLQAEMVQCKHVVCGPAFESVQVLNCKDVLNQFQFQSWPFANQAFQMAFVQKVIDLFFVDLEITAINGKAFPTKVRLLFNHFVQKID
jgi:hypothetical protein